MNFFILSYEVLKLVNHRIQNLKKNSRFKEKK